MKCSRCGTDFQGNFCPNCAEPAPGNVPPKRKKKIKWWQIVLYFVLVIVVIGMFNDEKNPTDADTADQSNAKTPSSSSAVSEVPEDAPLVCYLDFYHNSSQYKDTFVKFACRVNSVSKDSLEVTEELDGGRITIRPADSSQLEHILTDNCITVIGRVGTTILGWCTVSDANILDLSGNSLALLGQQKSAYYEAIQLAQEEAKAAYIEQCTKGYLSYSDLIRNPDTYQGDYVQLTVTLEQKMDGGLFDSHTYFRCYYGTDELILCDKREVQSPNLIVGDTVIVYGQLDGVLTATRSITKEEVEIPLINGAYIDLDK